MYSNISSVICSWVIPRGPTTDPSIGGPFETKSHEISLRGSMKERRRGGLTVKEMSDSVVSHVDSRVGKRFDQELRIPRKFRTESVRSRARPLSQPPERSFESISSFGLISVHSREEAKRERKNENSVSKVEKGRVGKLTALPSLTIQPLHNRGTIDHRERRHTHLPIST